MSNLVLARKPGETVAIGRKIRVTVLGWDRGAVKLAIEAPPDVPVHRLEIYEEIQAEKKAGRRGPASAQLRRWNAPKEGTTR